GQTYAVVVRSPHAHAHISSIDSTAAVKKPGVLAVLTGADVVADGLKPVPLIPAAMSPPDIRLPNRDGSPHKIVQPSLLALGEARFVGEAVAFVVAETVAAAKDAAEALRIAYEALPSLTDARLALREAPNVAVDSLVGDAAATDRGFAGAAHLVRLSAEIPRVTGVPLEPRAALGHYDPAIGRYTLHAGGGALVRPKKEV